MTEEQRLRRNELARQWRRNNPERSKEIGRDCYRRRNTKSYPCAVKARRRYHLKALYGLSLEEYEQMLAAQNGVCAICNLPETKLIKGTTKSLNVDHNHDTGEVRELLCGACNAALGLMREDPEKILALLDYAIKYNGN